MATSEIVHRRKALFGSCLAAIERDWSDLGEPTQRSADRLYLTAEDGTELRTHLASVKQGYGFKAGEFGTYYSLILCKGPIWRVMRKLRLLSGKDSSDGRIFQTNSLNLKSGSGLFNLRLSDDPAKVAKRIAADFDKLVGPLARRILERRHVPKLVAEMPDAFEKPFGTVVAVTALNGNLATLEKFWSRADGESIWDRPSQAKLNTLMAAAAKAVSSKSKK